MMILFDTTKNFENRYSLHCSALSKFDNKGLKSKLFLHVMAKESVVRMARVNAISAQRNYFISRHLDFAKALSKNQFI